MTGTAEDAPTVLDLLAGLSVGCDLVDTVEREGLKFRALME